MVYEIVSVAEGPGGNVYAVVRFWRSDADRVAGRPPLLVEDFIVQVVTEQRTLRRSPLGWQQGAVSGEWRPPFREVNGEWERYEDPQDPWAYDSEPVADVGEQVIDVIEHYIDRAAARGHSGDRRDRSITPRPGRGIAGRPDVQALRGRRGSRKAKAT